MNDKLYYTIIAACAVILLLTFSIGVYISLIISSLPLLFITILLVGVLILGLLHAYEIYFRHNQDS